MPLKTLFSRALGLLTRKPVNRAQSLRQDQLEDAQHMAVHYRAIGEDAIATANMYAARAQRLKVELLSEIKSVTISNTTGIIATKADLEAISQILTAMPKDSVTLEDGSVISHTYAHGKQAVGVPETWHM